MDDENFIDIRLVDYSMLLESLRNEIITSFALPSSIISANFLASPEVLKAAEQTFKRDVLEPLLKHIKD